MTNKLKKLLTEMQQVREEVSHFSDEKRAELVKKARARIKKSSKKTRF